MKSICSLLLLVLCFTGVEASAARIKDIANVRGVRGNQLVGYGLVVGLKGTGDSKAEYTNQSFVRMLEKLGMKLTNQEASSKNVAAVILTAEIPAFGRAGNKIDVTVNSIGDATSLKGGTLIQSPLRAADQQIYAVAQGPLLLGDNQHTTVAKLPMGAVVERDLDTDFTTRQMFRLTLFSPDFTTAARLAKTVNLDLGGQYASAVDAGTVDIVVPDSYQGKGVELLAGVENLPVETDMRARVVINEKTGTVVIGENVRVKRVAISHGDLSLKVASPQVVKSGPSAPASQGGQTPQVFPQGQDNQAPVGMRGPASVAAAPAPATGGGGKGKDAPQEKVMMMDGSVSVGDLVKSLNQLGVAPKDLMMILQNLKAAGALEGELEIL